MRQRLTPAAPSGFTLVELLVVIAIIGALVALLLPAVQMARESARRTSCTNNLRQIGTAIHLYHGANNSFPPGGISPPPCCSTESFTSWPIAILPFLELKNLYEQYDQTATNEENAQRVKNDAGERRSVCQKFVPVYSCPSDIYRKTLARPDSGPARDLNLLYMPGAYRGVGGRSDGGSGGWWDNTSKINLPKHWKGVFHVVNDRLKPETFASVRDGLSNTLMVGEYCTRSHLARRTFWAYSYGSYNRSDAVPESRTLLSDWDRCALAGGQGDFQTCNRAWGSLHPEIVNFVLCDGSVRPIPQTINMKVFVEAATIAGHEFAPLP